MPNANDFNFNGSTVLFATVTLGPLRSIDYSETAAQVDVTGSDDGVKTFRAGIPDPTVTVTIVGGLVPAAVIGALGALDIAWQDATTEGTRAEPLRSVIVDRGQTGSMDGEITSTYTLKPAQVDA